MMQKSKRYLSEMLPMYGLPVELYEMQRGVQRKGDLRKDVIIIPAMTIMEQFNKTKGHIHKTGHKELYHVMEGEAIFLMQKGGKNVKDCYAVHAVKGQSVIIPGDYYHVTINVGDKTLKMYNWISEKSVSAYKFIEDMEGMCYYLYLDRYPFFIHPVKNKNYNRVPDIRHEKPLNKLPTSLKFLL